MVTWARVGVLDFNSCSKALILPGSSYLGMTFFGSRCLDPLSPQVLVWSFTICMNILAVMLVMAGLEWFLSPSIGWLSGWVATFRAILGCGGLCGWLHLDTTGFLHEVLVSCCGLTMLGYHHRGVVGSWVGGLFSVLSL